MSEDVVPYDAAPPELEPPQWWNSSLEIQCRAAMADLELPPKHQNDDDPAWVTLVKWAVDHGHYLGSTNDPDGHLILGSLGHLLCEVGPLATTAYVFRLDLADNVALWPRIEQRELPIDLARYLAARVDEVVTSTEGSPFRMTEAALAWRRGTGLRRLSREMENESSDDDEALAEEISDDDSTDDDESGNGDVSIATNVAPSLAQIPEPGLSSATTTELKAETRITESAISEAAAQLPRAPAPFTEPEPMPDAFGLTSEQYAAYRAKGIPFFKLLLWVVFAAPCIAVINGFDNKLSFNASLHAISVGHFLWAAIVVVVLYVIEFRRPRAVARYEEARAAWSERRVEHERISAMAKERSWQAMSPRKFEYAIGELMRRMRYSSVRVTQAGSDGGVDILAERDGQRIAVQCKKYTGRVGVTIVRELRGSMVCFQCDQGIVATTGTFTATAKVEAKQMNIELWDIGMIVQAWQKVIDLKVENGILDSIHR